MSAYNKHPHYDLLVQAAADMTLPVWRWGLVYKNWHPSSLEAMVSYPKQFFAVGVRPSAPPEAVKETTL